MPRKREVMTWYLVDKDQKFFLKFISQCVQAVQGNFYFIKNIIVYIIYPHPVAISNSGGLAGPKGIKKPHMCGACRVLFVIPVWPLNFLA